MKLFTVATHNYGYYNSLKYSSKKNGFQLINLALGKKWKGLVWKFELMLDALENLNDNEVVAFCDGFDVIVTNQANILKKIFYNLNCDILFGKENSNYNTLIHYLSYICFKNYYLLNRDDVPNSGVYVGYVGKIKKFLKICLDFIATENDDQDITYKIYHQKDKYNFKIKLLNEFIYTIPFDKRWSNVFSFNDFKINEISCDLNKVFFVHANGNRNMDIYCKLLNYPLKIKGKKGSNHNHIVHFSKMLLRNNFKKVLFIVIIIILYVKYINEKK